MKANDEPTFLLCQIRGLCTGAVAALLLGGSLVFGISMLVEPSSSSLFANYHWARMGFGSIGVGFVYAWIVVAICQWAGETDSWLFVWFGILATVALAVAITWISFGEADWQAGAVPPIVTALIWVALPFSVGGVVGAAARMES